MLWYLIVSVMTLYFTYRDYTFFGAGLIEARRNKGIYKGLNS